MTHVTRFADNERNIPLDFRPAGRREWPQLDGRCSTSMVVVMVVVVEQDDVDDIRD